MRNLHIMVYVMLVLLLGAGTACAEGDAAGTGPGAGLETGSGDSGEAEAGGAASDGTHNPYRAAGTPVNAAQAIEMASKVRDIMVQRGDLARSWAGIKITETKQRTYNNEKEWIITLTNPQEVDQSHRTLYIFLDPFGDVADMNYTGQ